MTRIMNLTRYRCCLTDSSTAEGLARGPSWMLMFVWETHKEREGDLLLVYINWNGGKVGPVPSSTAAGLRKCKRQATLYCRSCLAVWKLGVRAATGSPRSASVFSRPSIEFSDFHLHVSSSSHAHATVLAIPRMLIFGSFRGRLDRYRQDRYRGHELFLSLTSAACPLQVRIRQSTQSLSNLFAIEGSESYARLKLWTTSGANS